jgi:hypothetical protein
MRLGRPIGQIPLGRRDEIEVAVAVASAREDRDIPLRSLLDHVRRDVAHGETDARTVGLVRTRAVHDTDVMQRELARTQHQVDGLRFVDGYRDLLTARETSL